MKGSFNEAWTYDAVWPVRHHPDGAQGIRLPGYTADQQCAECHPEPGQRRSDPTVGVVPTVPVGGPVCAAAVSGFDATCVPWNIWNKGGVNQAQIDYLTVASSYGITASEYIVTGSVTGDLGQYGIKIPTAATGIDVNIGTEYRQETYTFRPDYIFANGFASGGNGIFTPFDNTFHVNEYFVGSEGTDRRQPPGHLPPGL